MLKSNIHKATLTGTELDYEGSVTLDENFLEKADILPGEQVTAEKVKELQVKIVIVDDKNKPKE